MALNLSKLNSGHGAIKKCKELLQACLSQKKNVVFETQGLTKVTMIKCINKLNIIYIMNII